MDNCSVCAPCGDSPLSVTGNIVGILTFVVAIAAAAIYRVGLVRAAAEEIEYLDTETRLRTTILEYKLRQLDISSNHPFMLPSEVREALAQEGQALEGQALEGQALEGQALEHIRRLITELRDLLKDFLPMAFEFSLRNILGLGIKYMMMRDQLRTRNDRIAVAHELLNDLISTTR
ncbi:hypothetical protein HD806DRAFT_494453 [Xylariaceae sp. AK1471]|nr:hypothetical protein HD806DRAFT_494453 [Xylariaceae sp. AK1471]